MSLTVSNKALAEVDDEAAVERLSEARAAGSKRQAKFFQVTLALCDSRVCPKRSMQASNIEKIEMASETRSRRNNKKHLFEWARGLSYAGRMLLFR